MEDLKDPLAIARALGVYEDEPPRKWWSIPRSVEINTEVIVLGAYALITLGVYIGLIVHP